MPSLLPFNQNGAVAERQPKGIELKTDAVIRPPVNYAQVGNARLEFTAQGKLPTEWAPAVVNEGNSIAQFCREGPVLGVGFVLLVVGYPPACLGRLDV